jgi:hypothetical protein
MIYFIRIGAYYYLDILHYSIHECINEKFKIIVFNVVELGVTQNYQHFIMSHISSLFGWYVQILFWCDAGYSLRKDVL